MPKKEKGVKLNETAAKELANAEKQVKIISRKIESLNKRINQLPSLIEQAELALKVMEKEKPLSLKDPVQMSAIERELQSIGDPRLEITQKDLDEQTKQDGKKLNC